VPAINDITEFHLQTIREYRSSFVFDVEWPAETVETGVDVSIPVEVENVVEYPQTATLALSIVNDGDPELIESGDVSIDSGTTERLGLNHVFDEPGEYVVSVNGTYTTDSLTVVDGEPTETEEANESHSNDSEQTDGLDSDPDVEDQPGFGVMQAIAALGGFGYIIKQRISSNE
jgi:hypothetical protein